MTTKKVQNEEATDHFDANDLMRARYNKQQDIPEGLSDIDSVNDTKSLHNRSKFATKGQKLDMSLEH